MVSPHSDDRIGHPVIDSKKKIKNVFEKCVACWPVGIDMCVDIKSMCCVRIRKSIMPIVVGMYC